MEGDSLPFQQAQTENGWGMSVVERIFERIQAFDTATVGTTQLIHKAHLRTYSIEKLRTILATGGDLEKGLMRHLDMIREFQTIEGMTLMDGSDKFETHSYSFAGVADVLLRFAEQVSGATGIPLVRLFGQSPRGSIPAMVTWKTTTAALTRCRSAGYVGMYASCLISAGDRCSASHCQMTSPSNLTSCGRCPTLTARQWLTTSQRRSLLW
jgi:hypothetical protein